MIKTDAIRLLGGSPSSAAREIGISVSAVSQWPDVLPASIADRVIAAIARKKLPPEEIGLPPADDAASAGHDAAGSEAAPA